MNDLLYRDRDHNLWVLLHQTARAILKARSKELRRYGITSRQAGVVNVIQQIYNKATRVEIARLLLLEPNSVSELLDRMERRGLVKKVKNVQGDNLVGAVLTEKGYEASDKSLKLQSIHNIMSSLSDRNASN